MKIDAKKQHYYQAAGEVDLKRHWWN
jgi:hypothetical protein